MSLTSIRPYFSERLIESGFTEWMDGFAFDNIPSNVLNKSFHQLMLTGTEEQADAQDLSLIQPVEIRCFFKGYVNVHAAIQEAIVSSEDVIRNCVNVENYIGTALTGVFFSSVNIEPLQNEENDNVVVVVLRFDCKIHICL